MPSDIDRIPHRDSTSITEPAIDLFMEDCLHALAWEVRINGRDGEEAHVISRKTNDVSSYELDQLWSSLTKRARPCEVVAQNGAGFASKTGVRGHLTAEHIVIEMADNRTCAATITWAVKQGRRSRHLPCSGIARMLKVLAADHEHRRQCLQQLAAAHSLLETIGIAFAAYDATGHELFSNALGKTVYPDVPFPKIVASFPAAVVQKKSKRDTQDGEPPGKSVLVVSCKLASGERRPAFIVRLSLDPPSPTGDMPDCYGVFVSVHAGAVAPSVLSHVFGLTPSEARIASELSAGHCVTEIAQTLQLSEWTVRTYLKGLYAKIGVTRQHQLVAWMADIAVPFAGSAGHSPD